MHSKKIYFIVIIVLILIASTVFVVQKFNNFKADMTGKDSNGLSNQNPISELTWTKEEIKYEGKTILSINDFPDEIEVAKDTFFGSSVFFTGAVMSPDRTYISITISGGVHEFGWLYEIKSEKIIPVAFSFDGGVKIDKWKNNNEVIFNITSPQPATSELIVDINNLPLYPKLKSNTGAEIRGEMGALGCPEMMIINKMPGPGPTKKSYYILDGNRVEIDDYDLIWIKANCDVPVQEVY